MLCSVMLVFIIVIVIITLLMRGGPYTSKLSGFLPLVWAHATAQQVPPASTVPAFPGDKQVWPQP